MLGPDATFRAGQREAIEAILDDGRRVLVVQRTGWGKSDRLLARHARPPGRRTRPHADHQPAARADAQPDRDGAAHRPARGHGQLRQRRRVGRRSARRSIADEVDVLLISPERLGNERVPARVSCRPSRAPSACSWSTRSTASPTGATTSGPTTGASARSCGSCPPALPVLGTTATANDRVRRRRRRPAGHRRLDGHRGPLRATVAAPGRVPAARPVGASRVAGAASAAHARARASSTASPSRTPTGSPTWLRSRRHRRAGLPRGPGAGGARRARGRPAGQPDARCWWPRSPWAWASTSPTSPSSSTTSAPARSSPTTSRSAGRAARWMTPRGSCSAGREDDEIGEYFIEHRVPARSPPEGGGRCAVGPRTH